MPGYGLRGLTPGLPRRAQIPLPPVDEKKKVIEDVDKDRRYAIDAAIVRTMKSRKVLQHQQVCLISNPHGLGCRTSCSGTDVTRSAGLAPFAERIVRTANPCFVLHSEQAPWKRHGNADRVLANPDP